MKKQMSFAIALLLLTMCYAQEFPVQWKSKFSFKPERWFYESETGKFIIGRSEEAAEMLDGNTGKPVWKLNFKNDLKVKSLARAVYNTGEGVVLFYNPDEKKKNGENIVVDMAAGKELWRGDAYAGVDGDDNYHFANSINAVTSKGKTIVFNNATKKFTGLDVHTGNIVWESTAYDTDIKNVGISASVNPEFARAAIYTGKDEDRKSKRVYFNIASGEMTEDVPPAVRKPAGIASKPGQSNSTVKKASFKSGSDFEYLGGGWMTYSWRGGYIDFSMTVDGIEVNLTGNQKLVGFGITYELSASGGGVKWEKKFEGKAVKQLFNGKYNDVPFVRMDVQGDKVFVMDKEITVFDLKTGNELWRAPFDNCDVSAGMKTKQEFGIAGWPLVDENTVYYVDLQKDNAIKKVDAGTGKVIWQAEVKDNARVPNLMLMEGVLVAQFGGMIETQQFIPNPNAGYFGAGTYKRDNRFDGACSVKAFDSATGKLLWDTQEKGLASKIKDKFEERITTIFPVNSTIVVASSENVFGFEVKTGNPVFKTSLAGTKLGDVFEAVLSEEDGETVYVFCDNGIASVNGKTGKLNYATKTDEIFWKIPGSSTYRDDIGKNTFIYTEKEFFGFDLNTGVVKGKLQKESDYLFSSDGDFILVRDSDKITRFSVNK